MKGHQEIKVKKTFAIPMLKDNLLVLKYNIHIFHFYLADCFRRSGTQA